MMPEEGCMQYCHVRLFSVLSAVALLLLSPSSFLMTSVPDNSGSALFDFD
jgi:hypothetical protein